MKRYLIGMVLAVIFAGAVLSCSDDMPAESY